MAKVTVKKIRGSVGTSKNIVRSRTGIINTKKTVALHKKKPSEPKKNPARSGVFGKKRKK
jgi:hypothetical protein|tara:strand:+ start:2981 stop:3160 length:180 start_codon:yes stop_codon:yes gene_type:complete